MAAQFNIVVKVNPGHALAGIGQVHGALKRIDSAALKLNQSLRSIFGFYAITEAIKFVYGLADAYTSLRNKLAVTATSSRNLDAALEETFAISQRTRTSWESTAQLYGRLMLSQKALGKSQQDIADFTERMNKAVIISGATSQEAAASILQLSQGMSSGTLAGEELRAVMEQLPFAAQVIAKGMNAPIGQLKNLAKQGKITPKVIFDAFEKDGKRIDEMFAKTFPTIGQGFTSITNAATKFFGETGYGSGVLSGLARILLFLGNNFETVGRILIIVAQIVGVQLARWAIGQAIIGLRLLAAAAIANPFTALLTVLGVIILALRQFGDEIKSDYAIMRNGNKVFASVGDLLRGAWEAIKKLGDGIAEFVSGSWRELTNAFAEGVGTTGLEFSFENTIGIAVAFIAALTSMFKRLKSTFVLIFGGIPVIIAEQFALAFEGVTKAILFFVNKIIDIINGLIGTARFIKNVFSDTKGERNDLNEEIKNKSISLQNIPGAKKQAADNVAMTEKHLADISARVLRDKAEYDKQYAALAPLGIKPADYDDRSDLLAAAYEARTKAYEKQAQILNAEKVLPGALKSDIERRNELDTSINAVNKKTLPNLEIDPAIFGATDALKNGLKEHLDGIKGDIDTALDDYYAGVAKANKERLDKLSKEKLSRDHGNPEIPPGKGGKDKAIADEWTKYQNQVESLFKKSNEQVEAQIKITEGAQLLYRALNEKFTTGKRNEDGTPEMKSLQDPLTGEVMSAERAALAYQELAKSLREAAYPHAAMLDGLREETKLMQGTSDEYEIQSKLRDMITQLIEKQGSASEHEADQLERALRIQQERAKIWEAEKTALSAVRGPAEAYLYTMEAIARLEESSAIRAAHAAELRKKAARDLAEASREMNDAVRFAGKDELTVGFIRGWEGALEKFKAKAFDIAGTVEGIFTKLFSNLDKFILDFVETGEANWKTLIDGIMRMLNELSLQIIKMAILKAIFSSASPGAAGASAAIKAIELIPGVNAPVTSPSQVARIAPTDDSPFGEAPDSQTRVSARTSTPSQPTAPTPGQNPTFGSGSDGTGGRPNVVVNHHYDRRALLTAMQGKEGRDVVVDIVRQNPEVFASMIKRS